MIEFTLPAGRCASNEEPRLAPGAETPAYYGRRYGGPHGRQSHGHVDAVRTVYLARLDVRRSLHFVWVSVAKGFRWEALRAVLTWLWAWLDVILFDDVCDWANVDEEDFRMGLGIGATDWWWWCDVLDFSQRKQNIVLHQRWPTLGAAQTSSAMHATGHRPRWSFLQPLQRPMRQCGALHGGPSLSVQFRLRPATQQGNEEMIGRDNGVSHRQDDW